MKLTAQQKLITSFIHREKGVGLDELTNNTETERKKYKQKPMVVVKVTRVNKKKKVPLRRHRSYITHDFLEYLRITFKWGESISGLDRDRIEVLLYLYPKMAFDVSVLNDYYEVFQSRSSERDLKMFLKEGWLIPWDGGEEVSGLYKLSHKAKHLCSNMHSILCGEKDLPKMGMAAIEKNIKGEGKDKYMDMIKRMNSERDKQKGG